MAQLDESLGDRTETLARRLRSAFSRWLFLGQDVILIGVAVVLLLAGLVVLLDAAEALLNALLILILGGALALVRTRPRV